jgi:hypothetical protein
LQYLLSDAKVRKNIAQQIFGGDLAGNFTQMKKRLANVNGK